LEFWQITDGIEALVAAGCDDQILRGGIGQKAFRTQVALLKPFLRSLIPIV
jgi:hypothetical protein